MKITTILLTVFALQVSAGTEAQISISGKELSAQKIFSEVTRQTGFNVFFDKVDLANTRYSVDFHNATVTTVIEHVLKNLPLEYLITGKNIFITRKEITKENISNEVIATQEMVPLRVSGRVVNQNNDPVQGATVTEKGTTNATSTTGDGSFALTVANAHGALVVTGANIEAYEIKLKGQSIIVAAVTMKVSKLDEIQVVAYGTNTQRYQVGSVSKVTAEEIASQPVSNPLAALQGRVPGLVVTSTSGAPGAAYKVQVRGQNSLKPTGGSGGLSPLDNPLIIIDGVPTATQNSNLNQYRSIVGPQPDNNPYGGISPFSTLNPSDIESIEILRDADATAIYGSRGANGVLLITTKKGRVGKTKINAGFYSGFSQATRTMRMMNTQEFVMMRKEALKNDDVEPDETNAPELLIFDTTRYTNWKDYFLGGTASATDANVSFTGGANNTSFSISAAYHKESYITPSDYNFKLGSFNANLKHTSTNQRFSLEFLANYGVSNNRAGNGVDGLTAFGLIPNYPELLQDDGSINWNYKGVSLATPIANPMQFLRQKYSLNANNLISNLQLSYQILPSLVFRSGFGYNNFRSEENGQYPKEVQEPQSSIASYSTFGTNNGQTWIVEPVVEFNEQYGKGKINVLVGGSLQRQTNATTTITGSNYNDDALLGSLQGSGAVSNQGSSFAEYKYAAMYARINYIYSNRYIINFSGRRDGSSRFGPGKQWGNFGAVGLGWIFSEEKAIKNVIPLISYGKLRVSYGTTGNDNIGNYQFQTNWQLSANPYQSIRGFYPANHYNPNFSWAVTKKFEAGIELGMWKDRLLVSAAWFQNRSGNQLVSYLLPIQTGLSTVVKNFEALVQNTGLELQLSGTIIKSRSFSWFSSANLSIPKNKLLEFPDIENSAYYTLYMVGQPLGVLRKLHYAGINDSSGLYQFYLNDKSITSNPEIEAANTIPIGSTDPKYYGGFRNTFTYKGFSLDVFFEFRKQIGPNFLNFIYQGADVGSRYQNQPSELLSSRWQKPGGNPKYQKFTNENSDALAAALAFVNSDASYSDASYIRLKTLSVSYCLPKTWLSRMRIENLRVFANGQNLFLITNYLGNDPETQNYYGIPPLRTIVAGFQLTL